MRIVVFSLLLLASSMAQDANSLRAEKLSRKVLCSCGCRELLNECSHKQCERRPAMRRTIAAALAEGKSDDQVLVAISQTYGSDVLVVPAFHGFNTLLWIVPLGGAVIAISATTLMHRRRKQGPSKKPQRLP